jgi:hypothetical protein
MTAYMQAMVMTSIGLRLILVPKVPVKMPRIIECSVPNLQIFRDFVFTRKPPLSLQ